MKNDALCHGIRQAIVEDGDIITIDVGFDL